MNIDLSGKTALVTGSTTGIGHAIAQGLAASGASVVTSLPDRSELGSSFQAWRVWFVEAARSIVRWMPPGGVAIFYQTDVRRDEVWVDKGYLVQSAAEAEGAALVWHKVVCRLPPDTPNPLNAPATAGDGLP